MRRAPAPALDLGVYVKAVPLLVRNPAIIVIPLLMAVIAVLVNEMEAVLDQASGSWATKPVLQAI